MNSAALLLRSGAGELVRAGRAQLHGPHQLRRDRDLRDAERDEVPEDPRRQRLLLGRRRLGAPARAHPDARQERPQHPARGRAVVRARPGAGLHGPPRDRLLADHRGPAAPRQPRDGRPPGAHPPGQDVPQRGAAPAAARQAQGADGRARLPPGDPEPDDPRPADPARGRRAPVRHGAVRRGPAHVGARRRLPCLGSRQPLRRRHELLPLVERGEPGAHGDGQRAARRRPPARAPRRARCARRRCRATARPPRPRRWRHDDRGQARRRHRQGPARRLRRHGGHDRVEHARGAAARPGGQLGSGAGDGEGARHRDVRRRTRRGPVQRPVALGLRHRLGRRPRPARGRGRLAARGHRGARGGDLRRRAGHAPRPRDRPAGDLLAEGGDRHRRVPPRGVRGRRRASPTGSSTVRGKGSAQADTRHGRHTVNPWRIPPRPATRTRTRRTALRRRPTHRGRAR